MLATTQIALPIGFDLLDEDEQQVLYITDDVAGQGLTLEIENLAASAFRPKALLEEVSNTNYHFQLVFRPNTLYKAGTDIQLTSDNATMDVSTNVNGNVALSFKIKATDLSVENESKITLKLGRMRAAALGGTRGTRVLLRYNHLLFGENTEDVLAGFREMHLNIVNHRGRKHIPLHVGFVGHNQVLNDGSTPNTLKVRVMNTSRKKVVLSSGGQLVLTADSGPTAWALASAEEIGDMKVNITSTHREPMAVKTEHYSSGSININLEDETEEVSEAIGKGTWTIPFPRLASGQYVDIEISQLRTKYPTGYSHLYLHYENIPGYWDGQFVLAVEKCPMVFNEGKVGIGTSTPEASLHIAAKSQTADGQIETEEESKKYTDKISVVIGKTTEGENSNLRLGYHDNYSWIQSHGKKPLAINPINIYDDEHEVYMNNVGIGTTEPKETLDVNGTIQTTNLKVSADTSSKNLEVSNKITAKILHLTNENQAADGDTLILGSTDQANLRLGYNESYSWIQSHDNKPLKINPLGNEIEIGGVSFKKAELELLKKLVEGNLSVVLDFHEHNESLSASNSILIRDATKGTLADLSCRLSNPE